MTNYNIFRIIIISIILISCSKIDSCKDPIYQEIKEDKYEKFGFLKLMKHDYSALCYEDRLEIIRLTYLELERINKVNSDKIQMLYDLESINQTEFGNSSDSSLAIFNCTKEAVERLISSRNDLLYYGLGGGTMNSFKFLKFSDNNYTIYWRSIGGTQKFSGTWQKLDNGFRIRQNKEERNNNIDWVFMIGDTLFNSSGTIARILSKNDLSPNL